MKAKIAAVFKIFFHHGALIAYGKNNIPDAVSHQFSGNVLHKWFFLYESHWLGTVAYYAA